MGSEILQSRTTGAYAVSFVLIVFIIEIPEQSGVIFMMRSDLHHLGL